MPYNYGCTKPKINSRVSISLILTHNGTYLSVPTHDVIRIIVSYRAIHGYVVYEYLSCPRLALKEKRLNFSNFRPYSADILGV